jgi:HPt (histidine-containing phosphotransfer) domain-containing protein
MTRPEAVNRGVLDDLLATVGNDSTFLAELIDTYLVDGVGLLAAVELAIADRNADDLRRAAHSLKSNSATLGARALAALCLELEEQARRGDLTGALERSLALRAAFADVELDLQALRPVES